MAEDDPNIIMTTAEKQILEHPATLRMFLSFLVPCVVLFNIYVALSGRILASMVLCFQLAAFIGAMGVMKSRVAEVRKILAYRYIFSIQILVFGLYLLLVVGVYGQMEVSFWCFLFIFLAALWMPERTGAWSVVIFNIGIIFPAFFPDIERFLDNSDVSARFYVALVIFSLLTMGATRVRERYLGNLQQMRTGLEASEKKYQDLYRQLAREIQHRDKIEKRLHHAIKMETLGRVAAGVAHDLNNILSGLVTYPDLLLMDVKGGDPMRGPLETIKSSGARAAAIVEDLLVLSRRGVAVSRPVDLCRVVRDYMASPEHRQLMAEYEAVRVFTACNEPSAFVSGSAVHLSKTLMNLVSNAVEAVSGPGTVVIGVDSACLDAPAPLDVQVQGEKEIPVGQYVLLSVSDTGSGISPEDQEAVFEPFFTRKKMGRSGTGLGMALVLETVNDHGGYIRMKSSPGKGTELTVFFPAAEEGPDACDGKGEDALQGEGESILVVDDEPVQRKITEELLRRLNYRAVTCCSGEEALDFFKQGAVDLVIMDIIMEPGMSGIDACESILAARPDQKLLFVTGYSDALTLGRASSLSRGDCLFKPYTLEKLGRIIKDRLGSD